MARSSSHAPERITPCPARIAGRRARRRCSAACLIAARSWVRDRFALAGALTGLWIACSCTSAGKLKWTGPGRPPSAMRTALCQISGRRSPRKTSVLYRVTRLNTSTMSTPSLLDS